MTMIIWYRLHDVFIGLDKNYSVENMLKTSIFEWCLLNMVKLNSHNDSFRRVKYSYKNYNYKDMPLKSIVRRFKRGFVLPL